VKPAFALASLALAGTVAVACANGGNGAGLDDASIESSGDGATDAATGSEASSADVFSNPPDAAAHETGGADATATDAGTEGGAVGDAG
jgi:hypothetical protein